MRAEVACAEAATCIHIVTFCHIQPLQNSHDTDAAQT